MVYQYTLEEAVDACIEKYRERADSDDLEACLEAAGTQQGTRIALGLLGLNEPERAVPAFQFLVPTWLDRLETKMEHRLNDVKKGGERGVGWYWRSAAFVAVLSGDSDSRQEVGDVIYEHATHPAFDQLEDGVSLSHNLVRAYGALLSNSDDFTDHYEKILDRLEHLEKKSENTPENYREHAKDYEAQAKALLAIRRGNRDEFIEAIELWFDYLDPILESKKRSPPSDKDPIRDRVDITASALIALARQHGLDVRVEHDVVPEALYNEEYYPRGE